MNGTTWILIYEDNYRQDYFPGQQRTTVPTCIIDPTGYADINAIHVKSILIVVAVLTIHGRCYYAAGRIYHEQLPYVLWRSMIQSMIPHPVDELIKYGSLKRRRMWDTFKDMKDCYLSKSRSCIDRDGFLHIQGRRRLSGGRLYSRYAMKLRHRSQKIIELPEGYILSGMDYMYHQRHMCDSEKETSYNASTRQIYQLVQDVQDNSLMTARRTGKNQKVLNQKLKRMIDVPSQTVQKASKA